jgi:RNA polymerase sigma-70 factor, ECF subfamily
LQTKKTNISEQVWKDHQSMLRAFIQSRVSDDFAADDILQDVFLKMHSSLPAVNDLTKLKSWLYQITRNTIIDHYRSRNPGADLPDDMPETEADPGAEILKDLSNCLQPMIQSLPDNYREAVHMSEIQGLSQKEVAALQGISLSGAKSRVQRGRAQLKEMLTECCEYEFDQAGRLSGYEPRSTNCESNC